MDDDFLVGSLAILRLFENGEERLRVEDQLPCKIIDVSHKADEVQITVRLGKLPIAASNDNQNDIERWEEGDEVILMDSDILVLHKGDKQEGPSAQRISRWSFSDLDVHKDNVADAEAGWKTMMTLATDLGIDHQPLDRVCDFIYGDGAFTIANAWRTWLWVCYDLYWHGTPSAVYFYTHDIIEYKKKSKAAVDRVQVEDEAKRVARQRKEVEASKEARQRLVKLMMARSTSVLASMNDREIQQIAQKCSILQVEQGDELVLQGVVGDAMYIVIAGELDGVLAYGEQQGVIRKKVLAVTAGVTFGEESLLCQPSRVTVIATKSCELGVASQRNCEFIVQQSPDMMNAVTAVAEGRHKPVLDFLMKRTSPLFALLGDHEVKFFSRNFKIMRIKKDKILYEQGEEGDSMFLVVDGFVRLYNTLDPDRLGVSHTLEVKLLAEGDAFEEPCLVLKEKRRSKAVALASSIIAEVRRTDVHTVLTNPKYANIPGEIEKTISGHTSLSAVSDALMRNSPSALFSFISPEERQKLSLGAVRTEFDEGEVLQKVNQVCLSVYIVIDGELEVVDPGVGGTEMRVLAKLTRGHTFGEFCVVACAKGQAIVRASKPTSVIDIPIEICEPLILSRPDVVDDMHDIKLIFRRRHTPIELQAFHIAEMLEIFRKESEKGADATDQAKKDVPYFSRWSTGETMEVHEISPPLYGAMPSIRGRYERSSIKLGETNFTRLFVGYDTDWNKKVAWNQVLTRKLSTTIRMQFLQEVETTLMLTNEQPTWLRYSMVEDRHGNLKMIHHWELSQARQTKEMTQGFTPRSRPMGEAFGPVGIRESQWESITSVAGWRAQRPWLDAEKPADWDGDGIPDRFLSEEQQQAKANSIVKCYNYWENEHDGSMVFITEMIEPMSGVAKRGFTCLQLGNYIPSGHLRREKTANP